MIDEAGLKALVLDCAQRHRSRDVLLVALAFQHGFHAGKLGKDEGRATHEFIVQMFELPENGQLRRGPEQPRPPRPDLLPSDPVDAPPPA